MIYLFFGAVGTLAVLGLLACGVFIGWKANGAFIRHSRQYAVEEATEEQRRQLLAQQQAFEEMLGYNADAAYGLTGGAELE